MPTYKNDIKNAVKMTWAVEGAEVVTPSDVTNLTKLSRGLYLGTSGDVAVILQDGSEVTFTNLTSGVMHPIAVGRVKSTGTTATNILALF